MSAERRLTWFLRITGSISMLAVAAVFMPSSMMGHIYAGLGLGAMPDGPVFEYLARSESALYTIVGAVLWVLSSDVRRYRPVIVVYACLYVVFGLTILAIDWRIGLPIWWVAVEGPTVIVLGVTTLWLVAQVRP